VAPATCVVGFRAEHTAEECKKTLVGDVGSDGPSLGPSDVVEVPRGSRQRSVGGGGRVPALKSTVSVAQHGGLIGARVLPAT
jgi:hypothetical protein